MNFDVDLSNFISAMLTAGLLAAVPLTLAALGEAVTERSGLLNLGIEGMMLAGAFFGFWAAYETEQFWIGILAGIGAGQHSGSSSGCSRSRCGSIRSWSGWR
jgi:ABC-type uncharacterized transport system permease subunit